MSNVHFTLQAGFRAVNAWQQNLIRNAQGLLTPGYNRLNTKFDSTPGGSIRTGTIGTASSGGGGPIGGGGDALSLSGATVDFAQGDIQPAFNPTSLAIKGQGYFVLAENLRPGAKLYLARAGDFKYDVEGRLVNNQGLFVVGGAGTLSDPPTPIRNPGDGSVVLGDLTLARVPVRNALLPSLFGPTIYQITREAGPLQALPNGRPEVGFVQPSSLEFMDRTGAQAQIQVETNYAQQSYKMFKDMLDSYNRMVDDAIGTVR